MSKNKPDLAKTKSGLADEATTPPHSVAIL